MAGVGVDSFVGRYVIGNSIPPHEQVRMSPGHAQPRRGHGGLLILPLKGRGFHLKR